MEATSGTAESSAARRAKCARKPAISRRPSASIPTSASRKTSATSATCAASHPVASPSAAQRYLTHVRHGPLRGPPRRKTQRRHEAKSSRSSARWSPNRTFFCSTSPPPASIPSRAANSGTSSRTSQPRTDYSRRHAVPRRSRTLPSRRFHAPGPIAEDRHAARNCVEPAREAPRTAHRRICARPKQSSPTSPDPDIDIFDVQRFGDRLDLLAHDPDAVSRQSVLDERMAAGNLAFDDIRVDDPTLENMFVAKLRALGQDLPPQTSLHPGSQPSPRPDRHRRTKL